MFRKIRSKIRFFLFRLLLKFEDMAYLFIGKSVSLLKTWDIKKLKEISIYGLPLPFPLSKEKKVYVEIGSGHGEVLHSIGKKGVSIIGFEWRKRFARESAKAIEDLNNAFVYHANAYKYIPFLFRKETIDGIYILFPDPWHKERHHKRRPLTGDFFSDMSAYLKEDGFILFASDWGEYVDFVKKEVKKVEHIYDIKIGEYVPELFGLPETHYYKKWVRKKRSFTYILLKKKNS